MAGGTFAAEIKASDVNGDPENWIRATTTAVLDAIPSALASSVRAHACTAPPPVKSLLAKRKHVTSHPLLSISTLRARGFD